MHQPASSLDLFTDSIRLMGDATMLLAMEFERPVDAGRLERALARCYDAYPILSSKLVRDGGPARWELQGLPEGSERIEVIEAGGDDRPLFLNPLDPYQPPQARVRLLRSPGRDTVVLAVAHAAADGHGLTVLARSLMEAYLDPFSLTSARRVLPERDTLWTRRLLEVRDDVPKEIGAIDPMWPSPCSPTTAPSTFFRAAVPPEGVGRIKALARSHGGTVNDVLMAAYFLSMSDLTGFSGPLSLFYPVNLRRYLPPGSRPLTNQAANVSFPLTRTDEEGMDGLLAKVVKETTRMKAGKIGIREQIDFDRGCDPAGHAIQKLAEDMHAKEKVGLADIFISNPGPFELPAVPGLKDAYVLYPGTYMPTACFVISTFNGTMSVSMGYQQDEEAEEAARRMLQGFVDHLPVDGITVL